MFQASTCVAQSFLYRNSEPQLHLETLQIHCVMVRLSERLSPKERVQNTTLYAPVADPLVALWAHSIF
jgi:hypothetical protein